MRDITQIITPQLPPVIPQYPNIDLIGEVRSLLISAGVSNDRVSNFYDKNHYIQKGLNKPPEVQRFLLNQFWNIQLMLTPTLTIDERFSLVPNGNLEDWLKLFTLSVLPFVVNNNLPTEV